MAAASIRRKHGDSPFIAEYIIPQLILQWITNDNEFDLDGIGYSSVSCKRHVRSPILIVNLVFPAKEMANSGHCPRLLRKFAMTAPIPWNLIARSHLGSRTSLREGDTIEFVPGFSLHYHDTEFCAVENKLLDLPTEVIK
jgi:hypothetical protein